MRYDHVPFFDYRCQIKSGYWDDQSYILLLPLQKWLSFLTQVQYSSPQPEDPSNDVIIRLLPKDKSMGPTRAKRMKASTARVTHGGRADPASQGGHDSDAGSSSRDQHAKASSPSPQPDTTERGASSAGTDIDNMPDLGRAAKHRKALHDPAPSKAMMPTHQTPAATPESSEESWPEDRGPRPRFKPELQVFVS